MTTCLLSWINVCSYRHHNCLANAKVLKNGVTTNISTGAGPSVRFFFGVQVCLQTFREFPGGGTFFSGHEGDCITSAGCGCEVKAAF